MFFLCSLFLRKFMLYCCHRVPTQLRLNIYIYIYIYIYICIYNHCKRVSLYYFISLINVIPADSWNAVQFMRHRTANLHTQSEQRLFHRYGNCDVGTSYGRQDRCVQPKSLTLSLLMLHICGVSKMFGEWYQKTNKTEDTNKLTLFVSSVFFVFWYHSQNF
jgi:hypothetical protein